MISDVQVELGGKQHLEVLKGFTCCRPHVPIPGKRQRRCPEQWSHQIQTDIHEGVLPKLAVRRLTHDYRLLLLFDGVGLAAVAGHETIEPAQMASRYIDFIAVRTDMRGQQLSDGRRCSDAALAMVMADIADRTPLVKVVTSHVDHRNAASIGFLGRSGALVGTDVVKSLRPVVILRM